MNKKQKLILLKKIIKKHRTYPIRKTLIQKIIQFFKEYNERDLNN